MKKIFEPRQSGKTTKLIEMSYEKRIPIICPNISSKKNIIGLSMKMRKPLIGVLTINEFKRGSMLITEITKGGVLMDDIEFILNELIKPQIHAITMTYTGNNPK